MLVIGGVLSFVVGPWYLGVGFLLLGAHRIYLGFSTKNKDEATSSSKE